LDREQLRIQVQHEADRLRALISNTGDAILSADSSGILQIVNPAAGRLLGSETLEGTDSRTNLPVALSTLISNWQAVGGNLPAVIELPWGDGSIQMVSLTPIPGEEASGLGWVSVLRDITHVKRMEELKSQMLVEASSRIRIPLAQAMNALVELNILTSQNDRVSEVVYRLTQIWKRIQEWGDDLNALVRLDSGISVQSTDINLSAVLDEVCKSQIDSLVETAGVKLDLTIEPELPQVIADPDLIRRLLNGLINRAISRSDKGGQIRLLARNHNGQVWVSVSDDGPAVSDADLPRIFEKSFVKTSSGPGVTGLEMALVKTIIDRMGGQVWVGGQGKRGSTIFICLPTSEQPILP
jgi:signal transduction histidine kinase